MVADHFLFAKWDGFFAILHQIGPITRLSTALWPFSRFPGWLKWEDDSIAGVSTGRLVTVGVCDELGSWLDCVGRTLQCIDVPKRFTDLVSRDERTEIRPERHLIHSAILTSGDLVMVLVDNRACLCIRRWSVPSASSICLQWFLF